MPGGLDQSPANAVSPARPLRVLIVAQFYPPVAGGAERHVRSLSQALEQRGHDVSVATIRLGEQDEETALDGGVRLHRLRTSAQRAEALFTTSRPFAPPIPDPEAVLALRRIIRAESPDVIHGHDWLARSLTPASTRDRRPFVMTLHDYSLVCAQKRLIHRDAPCSGPRADKCLVCAAGYYGPVRGVATALANRVGAGLSRRGVSMFLPVSDAVAEGSMLRQQRLPYRVVPNFVPDELGTGSGDERHPELAALPDQGFILFVGDITRDKGVETLLQAYRRLEQPPPLVLIGRRDLRLGDLPPGVTVLDVVPHAAVMSAWRRCLFGVVPSVVPDACPTVVLEAMAAGRPVVAANCGGIPELVEADATGILVPPGDPRALAQALERLLAGGGERERMGEEALRSCDRFRASAVVPRIEAVYHEVLAA
jgi:glycosyltransferase involved in cell wall biosynthesis